MSTNRDISGLHRHVIFVLETVIHDPEYGQLLPTHPRHYAWPVPAYSERDSDLWALRIIDCHTFVILV